jgi:hypothetical protein
MERTHITTREDIHQKSAEQVDREGDTAAGIAKEGKIRSPRVTY